MDKSENNIENDLVEKQVQILVTYDDKCGIDISKMSDFMELYVQQRVNDLVNTKQVDLIDDLPFSDIGIINEIIQNSVSYINDGLLLVPDFERIPKEIARKLKNGEYSIGESKQVDGNLRPVILDENGVRIKDITLKRVLNSDIAAETTRNIANQLQMKQIIDKIDTIQRLQNYQLDRDRNDIINPFLNARDSILHAQNSKLLEDRNSHLEEAVKQLTQSKNCISSDILTTSKYLSENTSAWLIFQNDSVIKKFIWILIDDLQLLTKVCGLKMQIYEYLGQNENVKIELEQFNSTMRYLVKEEINDTGMSTMMLIHNNFKYSKENRDCWYNFSKQIEKGLENTSTLLNEKETYILSLEDGKNE